MPIGRELVERGYVLAAFENNALMKDDAENPEIPRAAAYPEATWAAIAVWAWGFSKIADYLSTAGYVDMARLVCTGHSRNGKAALAAGAYDERFFRRRADQFGLRRRGLFPLPGRRKERDSGRG